LLSTEECISSDDETTHEKTLSKVEEHMIVRAMKKSKQCFIDENLARLHEDQQYNREMVQILKDSSPMKKSLSESE
jgi:tRNA1(Val) A37 N6-methylase TrmN6